MAAERAQVHAELRKLFALKGDYALDPKRASPAFLALAAEAKAAVGRAARSMEVRSSPPAAEVFVDGVFRGIAPVSVGGLAPEERIRQHRRRSCAGARVHERPL
jgi:hypothetical protein